MRVEVSDHPASAVVVDKDRMRAAAAGRVRAHGDLGSGHRDPVVGHRRDVLEGTERGSPDADGLSRLGGRRFLHGLEVERGHRIDHTLGLGIERHGTLPRSGRNQAPGIALARGRKSLTRAS
jgi:hypothetical protein